MKAKLLYSFYLLFILQVTVKTSFSQCSVSIAGGDFPWCNPCEGSASANASGGASPYTYNWSTGDTTDFVSGLCAGTYSVTVTDGMGCVATDSVTINQIGTPLTVSMTSTAASCPACCDVCVNVYPSGGCIGYTYTWTPGDPNWPSPCGACPFQTYTVTVTDACGCSAVDSITTDTVDVGTGLTQLQKEIGLSIYPNPATETITISYNLPSGQQPIIQIHSVTGTLFRQEKINKEILNISNLPAGVYIITLRADNGLTTQTKFIKLE